MSYEWLEMQRESERHAAIEQYLRQNLVQDVYGSPTQIASPHTLSARAAVTLNTSPSAAAAAAYHLPPGLPVHMAPLTVGDKVRMTFTDLDYDKNGVIDSTEFQRGMDEVKIPFGDPTALDLFNKAKNGKPGDLTEPEWYSFVTQYPMLLDALFHRFRAIHNAERDAAAARDAQERLKAREDALAKEVDAAQKVLAEAEAKLAEDEEAVAKADAKKRESDDAHKDAVDAVSEAFKERQATEQRVSQEWEETRALRIRAAETARDIDAAQRRLEAAIERERWALQTLEAAKKEKEQAQAGLDEAQSRKVEVASDTDPEVVLRGADRKVADAQRKEYELVITASENSARADRARWARDEQESIRAGAEARLQRARDALKEATEACTDNDQRLTDAENVKANGLTIDDKENELVQQEIRLKVQREVLEVREGEHQRDCNAYTQRVSPQRERIVRDTTASPYRGVYPGSPSGF